MYEKMQIKTWEAHSTLGYEYGMTIMRHKGETWKQDYA
jgi:hypothetical protein